MMDVDDEIPFDLLLGRKLAGITAGRDDSFQLVCYAVTDWWMLYMDDD